MTLDMEDIEELESIIDKGDESNTYSWGEDCATYLQVIARTQLLILKELRLEDIK